MRTNVPTPAAPIFTHEGAKAARISPTLTLRRMTLAALLFEDQHYESGAEHAANVAQVVRDLVAEGKGDVVASLAVECRQRMYLRHMPLYLLACLTPYKGCGPLVAKALPDVVQRADELAEFVAIYAKLFPKAVRATVDWKTQTPTGGARGIKLSAGVKRGLAAAFGQFSAYDLAKYNRAGQVSLVDVLRYVHPKPKDAEQAALWRALVKDELAAPDTWEVALSAGKDKKATFERLIREKKLGGLAFLRNLRGMLTAKVDRGLLTERFAVANGFKYVLPFRFLAAAKAAPELEDQIDEAMVVAAGNLTKLPGHTVLVVDCSGSMHSQLSAKSELNRQDAASALAILAREQCERVTIVATAGDDHRQRHASMIVPPRRGMALRDAIAKANTTIGGGGIFLAQVMEWVKTNVTTAIDRVVVFTDEQDCDRSRNPDTALRLGTTNYVVNVGGYQHGIAYTPWVHVDGFSERVLDFVREADPVLRDGGYQ
jgi:60 kDa SS-A/Ro ribonucleoprotein